MKIVVQRAYSGPEAGEDTYELNHGQWVVDDNGTLHVRDANHNKVASYAHGSWVRAHDGSGARR